MSDYARANSGGATHFTDKDGLSTGDPNKVIVGAEHDAEFEAIKTAANSKFDTTNVASTAQAEAGTSNAVLMSPIKTEEWSAVWAAENGGMIANIQALADPGADVLLGWDESANDVIGFTLGAGILHTGTALSIDHDAATNFVADEHIAHSGVTITAGTGLTGGGTIAATRTLNVIGGDGITANANDIALTAAAASTTNPVDISSGVVSLDLTALTNIEGSALAGTDEFLVDDGGVSKSVQVQAMGFRVQLGQGSQTLAATDMNSIMEFNGTATLTLDENVTVDLPLGVPVVIVNDHATQVVTVQADTAVTLNSIFHPAGTANAKDEVRPGGTALLFQTANDEWYLSGDIQT